MANTGGTSSTETNRFDDNLTHDVNDFHIKDNQWTHARNAVNNSRTGDLGKLGNEPSNLFCTRAPYTIIGAIHLYADKWAIFSTDDVNSEIGLFIEDSCTYKTVVNAKCLAFNKKHLIKGVSRATTDCLFKIYWDDGFNVSRALEFDVDNPAVNDYSNPNSPIPWIQDCGYGPGVPAPPTVTCPICNNTPDLDCNKIRLARFIQTPCVEVKQGVGSGSLINGSYMVAIAYSIDGNRVSDYFVSNVQPLFNHQNNASSLDVSFSNLDQTFQEIEVVLIYVAAQNAVSRLAGYYSTRQQSLSFDGISNTWETVPLDNLVLMTPVVNRSDAMYTVSDYLIRSGTVSKEDFNYQPLANQIVVKWQSVEYPINYYRNGGNKTNYMRDEVYPFFIRWIYDTGDKSPAYHIPGRSPFGNHDLSLVMSGNVFYDEIAGGFNFQWQVENTAFQTATFTSNVLPDGGVVVAEGMMGYWESSEEYPDNKPEIWNGANNPLAPGFNATSNPYQFYASTIGQVANLTDLDLCGKKIRHHKFPELYTSPNTSYLNSSATKIRIMGLKFENIRPPVMNDGVTLIENIVGYEIMRGTRNGNKSILAKGLIKNMQEYQIRDGSKRPDPSGANTAYFVNYPYNDLRPDPFLVDRQITGATCSITGLLTTTLANNLSAYSRNLVSFHSPDTSFQDPFLSAKELKVVGEMNGDVTGQFDISEKHPKEKLISNFSFLLAFLSGLGLTMLAMNGKRRIKYISPKNPGYSEENIPGPGYTISYPTGLTNPGATSIVSTPAIFNVATSPQLLDIPFITTMNNAVNTAVTVAQTTWSGFSVLGRTIIGIYPTDNLGSYQTLYTAYKAAQSAGGTAVSSGEKQVEIDDSNTSQLPRFLKIGASVPLFLTNFTESADSILQLIKNITRYKDFALRYHSHCFYNRYLPPRPNRRRFNIENAQYIGSQISTFDTNTQINNLYGSRTVGIKIDASQTAISNVTIADPQVDDVTKIKASNVPILFQPEFFNSSGNISSVGALDVLKEPYGKPFGPYISWNQGSSISNLNPITPGNAPIYYPGHSGIQIASSNFVSLKQRLRNQYGQISGVTIVPASYCTFPAPVRGFTAQTSTVFGGDTYVTRYTEKNTFFFFYDWLYGEADGTQLDYKKHQMIPYAKYFANFEQFETGDFVQSLGNIFSPTALANTGLFVTPSDYYSLDGVTCTNQFVLALITAGTKLFKTSVKNQWFYLFNSGVLDFFTESEINVDLRDWGENDCERHYDPYRFTDTKALFDTGIIKYGNYYKYDYSLSIAKLFTNYSSWTKVQPASYNPYVAETCFIYNPTRVIYSLPEQFSASFDNWATFLPNNYYDFISRVTAVKAVNKSGALFFFEDLSPIMFQGLDQLQTTIGTALTIGDGKLFSQPSQNIINTERPLEYGSCQDRLSVINTPAGIYWMSQNQAKIFNYADGLAEVSMQDIKWWLINYLPLKLIVDFPDFELLENPVIGVGCQSVYDNQNGLVYFSKRDFKLRTDLPAGTSVIYKEADDFIVRTEGLGDYPIKLGNPNFFEDASWTLSFDPKTKGWVSYHDWHPNLNMPGKNTFLTTKDDGIWLHNYRTDSYCNFYGKDYPWEVEYMVDTGVTVNSLRSIEYQLECYKYAPNMYDRFHVLDYNFDHAVVYNTEQVSGFLNLYISPKKDPFALIQYPKINFDSIDILYSKEENRYRFNQFWDITADRGEYNPIAQRMIWNTAANGYVKTLNPNNMDYYKDAFQRKKFRHYTNSVFLRRNVSGDKKMLIMITNNKNLYSPR